MLIFRASDLFANILRSTSPIYAKLNQNVTKSTKIVNVTMSKTRQKIQRTNKIDFYKWILGKVNKDMNVKRKLPTKTVGAVSKRKKAQFSFYSTFNCTFN